MKNKIKRRRNKAITIRMTDAEYQLFQSKVEEAGISQQDYILNAISSTVIRPADEIAIIQQISRDYANLISLIRGLATNVNQMAHVANKQGELPIVQNLLNISKEIKRFRKETEYEWQLIRSSINRQNHTEQ